MAKASFVADRNGVPFNYHSRDINKYVECFDSYDCFQGFIGKNRIRVKIIYCIFIKFK